MLYTFSTLEERVAALADKSPRDAVEAKVDTVTWRMALSRLHSQQRSAPLGIFVVPFGQGGSPLPRKNRVPSFSFFLRTGLG